MNRSSADGRIAQLKAEAHAQRLAAQLAIFEAREQLAPLKSAAGMVGMAVRALSPQGAAGSAIGRFARFGIGHPWISSTAATFAWRLLRRRPVVVLVAAAAGATAWWLLRPTAGDGSGPEPPS